MVQNPPADPYTGDVEVGGPAQTRDLGTVVIRKVAVGPMNNNAYLLRDTATGEQLLIDAANEAETLLALVDEAGGELRHVVTTHRHRDHTGALRAVVDATGARTYAGADDADDLPVSPDVRLRDGDTVQVGATTLRVSHVRGHTPGSVVLALSESDGRVHLFTGDCLFPGGVGATGNSPDQSFTQLYADVVERIFGRQERDDTWVYPGHGADTTLGAERPHLDEWRARGW